MHSLLTNNCSNDTLVPIKVATSEEEETFGMFNYARRILASQKKYPKTLPFSKSVVVIFQLLHKFVAEGKEFSAELLDGTATQSQISSEVARSVESLLQRHLRSTLQARVLITTFVLHNVNLA